MSLCLTLLGEGTALDIFKYPNFSNYNAFFCSLAYSMLNTSKPNSQT